MLIHQGEGNRAEAAALYATKLRAALADLEAAGYYDPRTAVTVAGGISTQGHGAGQQERHWAAINALPLVVDNFHCASSLGIPGIVGNETHFTGEGLVELGKRYGALAATPLQGSRPFPAFIQSRDTAIAATSLGWRAENLAAYEIAGVSYKGAAGSTVISDLPGLELLPSGAAGAWGDISGTLSDQADLQAALDAKASTADVAYIQSAVQVTLDDTWLTRFLDSANRILGGWTVNGKFRAEGGLDWETIPEIEVYDSVASGYWWRLLTKDGRLIAGITTDLKMIVGGVELGTGGGGLTLADLAEVISADALPVTPIAWQERMRETRRKLADLSGSAPSETLVIVAGPGDSWTDSRLTWVREFTRAMKWAYGDAGPGYVSCYQHAADDAEAWWGSFTGWTLKACNLGTPGVAVPTMSLSSYSTSTAAASVTLTAADPVTSAALHYIGTGGDIRYKYGAGAWTSLTLSGTGLQVVSLASPPGGTVSLTLETVSGTVELAGVDLRNGAPGVVVHKCGMSGSRAQDWIGQDATSMQTGLAALGGDVHISMLAINDRGNRTATTFGADMVSLVGLLRTARPFCDILLATAPEILQPSLMASKPMPTFAAAARRVAADYDCAHIDLQPFFGLTDTSDYGDGAREYMTTADTAHPSAKGRPVVSGAIRHALSLL